MDAPITLRPYARADLEACMAIWRAASEAGHPFLSSADLDADAELIRQRYIPSASITVAELNGAPVGFIAAAGNYIAALFVHPDQHRKGIGSSLLDLIAAQHETIEVDVYFDNTAGRAFYSARRFEEFLCSQRDERGRALRVLRLRRPMQH